MPEYEYTARSIDGALRRGMLLAQDVTELKEKLREQGLTLTDATVGKKRTSINALLLRFQSVPIVEKMFFTQYLEVMIRSGFSIGRALETLAQQTSHKLFRRIIMELKNDVESGMSFSKSLAKHPRVFNEMFVNMVAAGESSGKLDEVLKRISTKMRKDHGLVSKVKGALTYPVIIVLAMVAIAILMIIVVIPKLTSIFTESGAKLPLPTRILVSISEFTIHNGIYVAVALVVLSLLLMRYAQTMSGKKVFHLMVLRLPIVGTIVKKISLARFSRSLSSLLETNIPIVETFAIISRTMGNFYYRTSLEEAGNKLRAGSNIAQILERYPRLFPPLTTQMIAVGEESGTLDSIAGELANFYEEEVDQTMANLSTIIEPVLMLILGAGVALMAVAVILPIYSLSQQYG